MKKKELKKKMKDSSNAIHYFSGEITIMQEKGTHPEFGKLYCYKGCPLNYG